MFMVSVNIPYFVLDIRRSFLYGATGLSMNTAERMNTAEPRTKVTVSAQAVRREQGPESQSQVSNGPLILYPL